MDPENQTARRKLQLVMINNYEEVYTRRKFTQAVINELLKQ